MIPEPFPTGDPKPKDDNKILYVLLCLAPLVLGLAGGLNLIKVAPSKPNLLILLSSIGGVLCIAGCCGLSGFMKEKKWGLLFRAIALGIVLTMLELAFAAFAGCCMSLGQIGKM